MSRTKRMLSLVTFSLAAVLTVTGLAYRATPAKAGGNGNIVILGLSKNARGPVNISPTGVITYTCNTNPIPCPGPKTIVNMLCVNFVAPLDFTTNAPCDERRTNGKITFTGQLIARADQGVFGCMAGDFRMEDDCGNIAVGQFRGTVGCGTHRTPAFATSCEKCRQPKHVEGWLEGNFIAGPLAQFPVCQICATFSGRTTGGNWPTLTGLKLNIDGAYRLACLP